MITIVEKQEVEDLLFVHTVAANLYRYTTYLRSNKIDEIKPEMFKLVTYLLKELIFFVTVTESNDPETCEGYPIKSRQKLMREIRLVELIVDCLYYPFLNDAYQIHQLTDDMPMKRIVILCYRFLLHCVKDYRLNELYASQWIELYLDQSMSAVGQNIKAEATIAVLVSNNKTLLQKQITRETIEKFIDLCKEQEKDEKFVLLLTALCSCMNEAIINNQNNIIELILENNETKSNLLLPIQEHNGSITIEVEDEENTRWVDLKDIKEYSEINDGYRLYKYYIAFIDLMAEMCLQRNHRAFNQLVDVYSLNIVHQAIVHPSLESQVKSKFLKLMYNMYIDKEPFDDLKVPNLTRVWNEVTVIGNKIQHYKRELPNYIKEMKKYVLNYLRDTNGVQNIFEKDNNSLTLEVIKLVNCMVSYGFYKTKEELREISLSLITLLNGTTDVYTRPEENNDIGGFGTLFKKIKSQNDETMHEVERYQKSEDNFIIMKCKQCV